MGFIDKIKKKYEVITDENYNKKKFILKFLSMPEMKKIEKHYYGKDLLFYWTNEHGIEKNRPASRNELTLAMSEDVDLDIILTLFPKLKEKLK